MEGHADMTSDLLEAAVACMRGIRSTLTGTNMTARLSIGRAVAALLPRQKNAKNEAKNEEALALAAAAIVERESPSKHTLAHITNSKSLADSAAARIATDAMNIRPSAPPPPPHASSPSASPPSPPHALLTHTCPLEGSVLQPSAPFAPPPLDEHLPLSDA
jgi:hypothetical protein